MQMLFYEFSVLAKCVQFKNLSAAATHVGLSQPQLSRIIAKIEDELKIVLLDRTAKRKSGWTPIAFELSKAFEKSAVHFAQELKNISNQDMIEELRIGTLEGMTGMALKVAKKCFQVVGIKKITLDIFDLNELEANFQSGNLDVILSSKQPGRQKYKYLEEIGYQSLQPIESNKEYGVFSHFEIGRLHHKNTQQYPHILVSNSLAIRREWLQSQGGYGLLPSEVKRGRSQGKEPILMIGSDLLSPVVWKEIQKSLAE
ncbi:MAG: LysR family transcriptional regulator [Bdellovibrionia bacterium]